jgi:aspartyl-tRNA(Asn)/glutamyl-tRNA(Gln) amidotransferase subunit B
LGGQVEFFHKGEKRVAELTRIHMEEDTAKLLHSEELGGTLIDFNRCGVPLIEIVTEPNFRSGEEVKDFLEALRMLLATLDICNCKMQEGAIRFDINVSVRPFGQKEYGTRVEMKNVNTLTGAVLAIEFESNRQIKIIESGGTFFQETRRWDEQKGESVSMRVKETAADYRYFTEPNLTPVVVSDEWLNEIKNTLPELPIPKLERYQSLGVPKAESLMLAEQIDKAAFFEECLKLGVNPANGAKHLMGHITSILNKAGASIKEAPLTAKDYCYTLKMVEQKKIGLDNAKRVIDEIFAGNGTPDEIVEKLGLAQVSDTGELRTLVNEVLSANTKSIEDYKNGKSNALAFLVGQCMKASKGKANPQIVNELIREALT